MTERRKYARFKPKRRALAALSYSPTVAGHVVNISEGGLSFRYVASQKRSEESAHLNLLTPDGAFQYKALPFKTVWDYALPDDFSLGSISTRYCGVEFGSLSDEEKSEIRRFIETHTTTEANSQANRM